MADETLSDQLENGTVREDGLVFYCGKWRSLWSLDKQKLRQRQRHSANPHLAAERGRRSRQNNPEAYWAKARKFRATLKGRVGQLYDNAKGRSRRYGVPLTIDKEWIRERVQRGVCEVTGIAFELHPSPDTRYNPWGPSLDQIDPSKGYTPSNTQVVCNIHNVSKNEWSPETHRRYIEICARVYGLIT